MSVNVMIVDEHEVVRVGVKCFLNRTRFEVVAEAASGDEAARIVSKVKPDVVLMEVKMSKGIDGLAALRKIRRKHPDLPVVMLSGFNYPTYIARSLARGANGYLSKTCEREELLSALQTVAAGKDAWTKQMLAPLHEKLVAEPTAEAEKIYLTPREKEVITQLAYGLPNLDIALALNVSIETIKEHVGNIRRKLGVDGRVQAAVWALRNGVA